MKRKITVIILRGTSPGERVRGSWLDHVGHHMKLLILFAACTPTIVFANSELCGEWKNPIEPDIRILESQLTAESANVARDFLAKHGQKRSDEYEMGRQNSRKTIKGYELKRAAESGGKAEVKTFCEWLIKEGFWHD